MAAYNGEPATASRAWEKLGQLELAANQARAAGELERAYNLLRQAGQPLPEELSIAVKFLRQAAQLTTKQRGLQPAERHALAEELTALLAVLTAGEGAKAAPAWTTSPWTIKGPSQFGECVRTRN